MLKSNTRQAIFFVLLTFTISWVEEYFIIKGDGIENPARAFCLMWTPGLVGIFCSILFDRNLKPIAFRRPKLKPLLIAYIVPALTAALIIFLLVSFSLSDFQVSPKLIAKKGSLGGALLAALVYAPTIGMVVSFVSGLGEELGWRGFYQSKLMDLSAAKKYFLVGCTWSIWHWPLILFGDYATSDKPWLNVIFFSIAVISLSFFMGWLRDRSNSSIPAALTHASHNMWILGISPAFYKAGPLFPYFGGESGVFCALLYLGLAWFIYTRLHRAPVG